MEKREQLYEGKAKKVFLTDDPECYIVSYKDDATAFNGLKKGTIVGKGVINNKMSNLLMQKLEKEANIPTHFVEELSDRETLIKKVEIVQLADWDTMQTNIYAKMVIRYVTKCKDENLPKEILLGFER